MCRARHAASLWSDNSSTRSPAMLTEPLVGRSSPPMRFSNVLLPEPDGPISARNSPAGTFKCKSFSTWISSDPRRKTFSTPSTLTRAWLAESVMVSSMTFTASRTTAAPSVSPFGQVHYDLFPGRHTRADYGFVETRLAHRHGPALGASGMHYEHHVAPVLLLDRGLGHDHGAPRPLARTRPPRGKRPSRSSPAGCADRACRTLRALSPWTSAGRRSG
jgi:hypothetical protein